MRSTDFLYISFFVFLSLLGLNSLQGHKDILFFSSSITLFYKFTLISNKIFFFLFLFTRVGNLLLLMLYFIAEFLFCFIDNLSTVGYIVCVYEFISLIFYVCEISAQFFHMRENLSIHTFLSFLRIFHSAFRCLHLTI